MSNINKHKNLKRIALNFMTSDEFPKTLVKTHEIMQEVVKENLEKKREKVIESFSRAVKGESS